jgi:iron-sulfur cluster assembly protein
VVELSHDTRPIIGRGQPLGATFLALAIASIALMVADQRYDQLERVRGWMSAAAYPVQLAVDLPFRIWSRLTESFADRNRLRSENLELNARLRLAILQLQRFAALEDENRRLRDMRENSAGVAERVREILDNAENDHIGLRIGVKNGGCAGQEYTFAYADEIGPLDEVVEDKGVTILIEPKAVLFLIGTEIDYETTRLASKFVFRNPNQTDACGCGESVTIVPASA